MAFSLASLLFAKNTMLRKLLRIAWKTIAALLAVAILLVVGILTWLQFYTRDLPDLSRLSRFSSATSVSTVSDECIDVSIIVSPASEIGPTVLNAMDSAELARGAPGTLRGMLSAVYADVAGSDENRQQRRRGVSSQVARSLFCSPERTLNRSIRALRSTIQIERRFTEEQILTIYANRAYFGQDTYGVSAAAERYFQKRPRDLDLAEAAWLAGLIRYPSHYLRHPDLAITRRNEVIDQMVKDGFISNAEATRAKERPGPERPADRK